MVLRGAEADLRALRRCVRARFGAGAWAATHGSVRAALARIAAHPEVGHAPDELAELGLVQYRQVLSGPNRILYEPRGSMVYVHLVCDARRDLKSVLLRRLLHAA